jgi:hypothetical protein
LFFVCFTPFFLLLLLLLASRSQKEAPINNHCFGLAAPRSQKEARLGLSLLKHAPGGWQVTAGASKGLRIAHPAAKAKRRVLPITYNKTDHTAVIFVCLMQLH